MFPKTPARRLLSRSFIRIPASASISLPQSRAPRFPQYTRAHCAVRHFLSLRIPALRVPPQTSSIPQTHSRKQDIQLPNHALMARAFHRPSTVPVSSPHRRLFSSAHARRKWEGRQADENTSREKDSHNVQHDAVKEGKEERAKGEGSVGTSEKGGEANRKAEREAPKAPRPVLGMNDERGGKGGS